MSRALRSLARHGAGVLLALLSLELLLPFAAGSNLDLPPSHARAFHRALLRPDRETLERLRASAVLAQDESAANSLSAPPPARLGIEIRTNAHGMRMREVELAKRAGLFRIAVLGDSVSFGWRVPESECWPRVLERRLRGAGREVEVLNFAVPGFTTAQAVAQLRTRALAFAPDLVVLATGFNDHWLRPGPADAERLRRAASSDPLAHAFFVVRRESAIFRAARRLFEIEEPGRPAPGSALQRRLPRAELENALEDAAQLCRDAGITLLLADLCLPHARTGDALRAFAARRALPFFDGRSPLGIASAPSAPLALSRRLRATVEPQLRARWERGDDELLALAFPGDLVREHSDLELRSLRRDASEAWLELDAGSSRDWALVPRSYLEDRTSSMERLMTLVYHRIDDEPGDGALPCGRFAGAAYDCADAPYAEFAHGEAIHPNAIGHARIAEGAARFLLEREELLSIRSRRGAR
ncbi:MAG: hypothetical protein JNM84_20340 [Planctomycetes bacterium]|nr:hypothetical protein [Planctomycetota bacterium]